jgi:hypothetical protein
MQVGPEKLGDEVAVFLVSVVPLETIGGRGNNAHVF